MDFNATLPSQQDKLHNARIRAQVRGHGICAGCFNPVLGQLDYPTAEDCQGFFHGELEEGDAICFWCLERWCSEPGAAIQGHG